MDDRPSVVVRLDERGNPAPDRAKPWAATVRMLDECRLDRLHYAGQITDRQWQAGMMFRARWLAAHRGPGYGIRYGERVDGGGGGREAEVRLNAADRIGEALAGMPVPAALAVQAVCGEDETARGRASQLITGLDHLAEVFGVDRGFERRPGM